MRTLFARQHGSHREYRINCRPGRCQRLCWAALLLFGHGGIFAFGAETSIRFNRDVRPILTEHCFACHGPDSASREADLRLDQRDAAIDAGAIAPGKPDESEMIARIFAADADEIMPPPKAHKPLNDAQKKLLREWIAAGAPYEPHWSLMAPSRPEPPPVKKAGWVRTPIDAFILAKLEAAGLEPAPEADRRTMIRRLYLDAIGLPPPVEEVERFVSDPSPRAYEELVERVMALPQWGEHRARYWLDAARYGDTHGIHFDNYREMYSYRDWVIAAFNRNQPFDQFTVEQLAGDLLPEPTLEQLIATGFNRCNITTNEGGTIPEENLVLYTRDRTETTATVWLGLTFGCAVCHDHKYDPISQKEFYSLAAFFNNTTQGALDGNIKDTPPIVVVPPVEDRARWNELGALAEKAAARLAERRRAAQGDFDHWLKNAKEEELRGRISAEKLHLSVALNEGEGRQWKALLDGEPRTIELAADGTWKPGHAAAFAAELKAENPGRLAEAGDFEGDKAFTVSAWVNLPSTSISAALVARMDDGKEFRGWDLWIEGGKPGMHLIHRWESDAIKVVAQQPLKPNTWHHVAIAYDGSRKAAGVKIFIDGKQQKSRTVVDKLKNTIRTEVPLTVGGRDRGSRFDGALLGDLRIWQRAISEQEAAAVAADTRAGYLVSLPAEKRTDAQRNELFTYWIERIDPLSAEIRQEQAKLGAEQEEIRRRSTIAHITQERKEPAKAYVLIRGEYDKRGEEVAPNTPACLPPMPEDLPRNRLGFARWLLRPENPLTTRVTVNRFWQELFGQGLVATAGDFGTTGEMPSHPELLDWLAVEFRESGWDVKHLFRLMFLSATYRQSAASTEAKRSVDPQNRLLSRGPRFRMDAETIRDYALAASGLLVPKIGGPSVKPYQPPGVWEAVAMIGSNTRDYQQDKGESLYRRSLYTFWKRAAPPASLEIFNAPSREVCTVRRERTNTPLQALVTLNDTQFVEAARHLAQRLLHEAGDTTDGRIQYAAARLLARPLTEQELAVVRRSAAELLKHYRAAPDDARRLIAEGESRADEKLDPAELAAWTMVVNQLMNLDEVLCK